ncbi:MAG: ABC transporter ATP-binding protein [Rhodobacteraceae bacterium]|uniref:ABC transporter ATP-binding protein n=1 Tax=Celeribacter sp. HF31 TaxID=2721558 RepID=UPI00142F7902|nr:ABC transporter ATP-binding protein [Celeribacter sp. HF31]NIY79287.1 ABC transporter ATP-binding protein [Celeribacter sp. HF31]NVK45773.1 ABC transporter ATP-binding protein [Paracoccaceae bacterium]
MVRLEHLTKAYKLKTHTKYIVNDVSLNLPSNRSLALIGRNGAGKSTLLRMISGNLRPDWGRAVLEGSVSWPVGYSGSFHGALTGAQNTRFVARVYGVDTDELLEFVKDFCELGDHFHMPVRTYSSGMKARLAFAVSVGIPFDTYIIDEVTSVGDASFRQKSSALIRERLKDSGAIVVSHNMRMVRELCDCGAVLENGKLNFFDDIQDAIAHHETNMKATDY